MSPQQAVKEDKDESICGSCIHRTLRTCYVQAWQAPRSVWQSWKDGKYKEAKNLKKILHDRSVRIGAYGDPAAVPIEIWTELASCAQAITGYTHLWRTRPHLARFCMASVDSLAERKEAKALGFRTFRVMPSKEKRTHYEEAACPASEEEGKKLTCLQCGYCNGNYTGIKGDVAIQIHGAKRGRFNTANH
jgi:hypothetical protein